MNIFVLVIIAVTGAGSVDMTKAGTFATIESCVESAGESGFRQLSKNAENGIFFACVRVDDDYVWSK